MPSVAHLFTLLTIAAISSATVIDPIVARAAKAGHHCPSSKVSHQETINVGGKSVAYTTFSCTHAHARDYGSPAPSGPKNVCADSCSTSCNNIEGILPPISEDCDTIENAIEILKNVTTTFNIEPDHLTTLTFGTCSYFFTNSGSQALQYCWAQLGANGAAAGAACFPPVHPFFPEGLCTSYDQTWSVGASHS